MCLRVVRGYGNLIHRCWTVRSIVPWFALFGLFGRPKKLLLLFLLPLIGGIRGNFSSGKLLVVLLVLELPNSPRPNRILNDSSNTCNICLTPMEFPMEFFVSFWDLLGPDLVRILNLAYRTGQLSTSQRQGIFIVLYKMKKKLPPY